MSGTPMSDEQRAALQQRLEQLRAAQAVATGDELVSAAGITAGIKNGSPRDVVAQETQPQEASSPNQRSGPPSSASPPAPQMRYAYEDDDDDNEEDELDNARQRFEDEFLLHLAQQQQGQGRAHPVSTRELNVASVAQVSATSDANEGVDVVATDKNAPSSHELGDFEVLRLAKMGDSNSMKNFGDACGITWRTFVDNRGRNALHYAADSSSAALIRQVADDLRVPYVADEKQITPLDIAILNGHTTAENDEVYAALLAAAKASGHADGNHNGTEGAAKTREKVLVAHAPAPPKFVMSKPVAKAPEATGERTFWSPTSLRRTAVSVQCSSGSDMSEAERQAISDAVCSLDHHGRLQWLRPVTRGMRLPCEHWQVAVASQKAAPAALPSTDVTGIVVAQVLPNASLEGSGAKKLSAATVAVAAHLAVGDGHRRAGVAAALLHALSARIAGMTNSGSNPVVFFASSAQLNRPPTAIATVKWFRRVFDASYFYRSDTAYDVFPDFFNYDEVLRADGVLKGAVPALLEQNYTADLPSWCHLEVSSDEQCTLLLKFIQAQAVSAESNLELVCVPEDVDELRRSYIGHPDHQSYVRINPKGSVTDFVVFRKRDMQKVGSSVNAGGGIPAVEVAYAFFSSISSTAKVDHMMLLALKLLHAKMLLVPTMFGITDSDLAKSNFDELVANREYIYAVSPTTRREIEGLGSMPAPRLSLPVYTM